MFERQYREMGKVIDRLKKHDQYAHFIGPVNPEHHPRYAELVKDHIDLGDITRRWKGEGDDASATAGAGEDAARATKTRWIDGGYLQRRAAKVGVKHVVEDLTALRLRIVHEQPAQACACMYE